MAFSFEAGVFEATPIHSPAGKANLFAETFAAKNKLPPRRGQPDIESPRERMGNFAMIRERWVLRELLNLDVRKATGPDQLSSNLEGMRARDSKAISDTHSKITSRSMLA